MGSPANREISLLEQAWPDAHEELVRALRDPACYPHRVRLVEHIETHISDVFLTGRYAYKLKKPLSLGFLDFSTLERRRFFCEEELRLNRRLAPELYLGNVPITGTPAQPRVAGEGEPFEYAVQMRQFEQAGLLERVAARGELTARHVDEVAEMVAAFHACAALAVADSPYGNPPSIVGPALQNFEQLLPLVEREADRASLERLQRWTLAQHDSLEPLLLQRHAEGFVRECHGDLHLGNMVLIEGRVRIFDCIEFNPQLRWIDVMSEVAFLAMDLTQRRHVSLAFRFLNRYLEITGDYAGLRLLTYYMVYRALVRAKVAAMRAAQGNVERAARQTLRAKCRAHLALAEELVNAARPALLILHGLSGSGKTSISQRVLEAIGGIRIRSDIERKRLHGLSEAARTASGVGAGIYSPSAGAGTYHRLAELATQVLQSGFPALVDATFLERAQRELFRSLAAKLRVPFAILHVETSEAALRLRIAQRATAGLDASEATADVLDRQLQTQDPLTAEEREQTYIFDTERMSQREIANQANQILQRLIHQDTA